MKFFAAPEFRGAPLRFGTTHSSARAILRQLVVFLLLFASPIADAETSTLENWRVERVPPLALKDLEGAHHDLEKYVGRPVVVHFFATWCEPCREELSLLDDWHAEGSGQHTVLAVNVAELPDRVRKYLAKDPVGFPVLLDSERINTKAWGVSTLPATFVIDAAGAPKYKLEGPLDWSSSAVRAVLARAGKQPESPNNRQPTE